MVVAGAAEQRGAATVGKINFNSSSRTSRTDDFSSDHHLVAAEAQPEADVFCGDQVPV